MSITRQLDMSDTADIMKCSDDWAAVAKAIGCTVYGFNDERSASFRTPDGKIIEIGPKFRAFLESEKVAITTAEQFIAIREQHGLTQRAAADILSKHLGTQITRGAVVMWEHGDVPVGTYGITRHVITPSMFLGAASKTGEAALRITDITTKALLDQALEQIFAEALPRTTTDRLIGHLRGTAARVDAGFEPEHAVNVRLDTRMVHSDSDVRLLIFSAGTEATQHMPRGEVATLLRQKADEHEAALREWESK